MPLGLLAALPSSPVLRKAVLAPPQGFRAAEGVVAAWASGEGPFGATPRRLRGTAAQRAGVRYERLALAHLATVLGAGFVPSQWFRFWNGHQMRFCQTDGLLHIPSTETLVIFECKTSFTSDAWWQLRKLYEPVVRAVYEPRHVHHVVVCKHFDPVVQFPEPFDRLMMPDGWTDKMGVYQWTP